MTENDILTELGKYQEVYDILVTTAEEELRLGGKRLDEALIPQPELQRKWGDLAAGVSWLYEEAKNNMSTAFGDAYKQAQGDNYKSISSTDAKWYAERDDDYNDTVNTKNKVFRLKKSVDNVVDVIESRKYILKDLTASVISQVNNYRLD